MLRKFKDFVAHHGLFDPGDRILLAVSGGLDSMVMLDLFRQAGVAIGVAHANFGLRGKDSDGDEAFVSQYCSHEGVPFYSRCFKIKNYAEESGLSIQMAARELRYAWFSSLMEAEKFHWLATAHHLNDNMETSLMRWIHGGGIDQLAGIPLRNEKVIRPLLFATREEIRGYAEANKVSWREDSSNAKADYRRNFVRHKVIPLLKEINPSLEVTFGASLEKVTGGYEMMQRGLEQLRDSITRTEGHAFYIDKNLLMLLHHPAFVCYEWLRAYGFEWDRCVQLVEGISGQPGKQFHSDTHQAVIDREFIIVMPRQAALDSILIEEGQDMAALGPWKLVIHPRAGSQFEKGDNVVSVDRARIRFPLLWRKWRPGDTFVPLGMKQHKKLSDFLIDEKVPLTEKGVVTVVESAGEIVWVVGHRIDDRFKVTGSTQSVFDLRISPVY